MFFSIAALLVAINFLGLVCFRLFSAFSFSQIRIAIAIIAHNLIFDGLTSYSPMLVVKTEDENKRESSLLVRYFVGVH